jgi:hypothetical protein
LLGTVGDLVSGGVQALLGKLPGIGDLPDWLQGTGKYVLDKAKDYISSTLSGALGGGQLKALGSKGLQSAMSLAQRMGLAITSTTGGQHVKGSYHYLGRAFDAAGLPSNMMSFARAMLGFAPQLLELFYDPLGKYVKNGSILPGAIGGHSDHVHTAMAQGGKIMPYVGAFKDGGFVGQTGMGLLHKGETVIPGLWGGGAWGSTGQMSVSKGVSQPMTPVYGIENGSVVISSWKLGSTPAALPGGDLGGDAGFEPAVDTTPFSQADIDTLNGKIGDLTDHIGELDDTITQQNTMIALQDERIAAQQRYSNVQDVTIEAVKSWLTEVVSGKQGGRVGVGFTTVSAPGVIAKH